MNMELNFDELLNEPNLKSFARKFLWEMANQLEAVQGAFYITRLNENNIPVIRFIEGYAYHIPETEKLEFEFGDGIAGQVAKDGKSIYLENVPPGYLTVMSGLGSSSPNYLFTFPINHNNQVLAVVELASFKPISQGIEAFLSTHQHNIIESLQKLINTHE
jgi:hypothetical protein